MHGEEIGADQSFGQVNGLENNARPEEDFVGAIALLILDLLTKLLCFR
jgi:hypothetical protein